MRLYFLRHGPAVDRSEWDGDDSKRPLTPEGALRIELEAQSIVRADFGIEAIVSSPYVRAVQTAEIVARALGLSSERLVLDSRLEPGFDLARLRSLAGLFPDCGSMLLVGHEPGLSGAIGELIGGGRIDMKKGALACVAVENAAKSRGELLWLLPPAFLTGKAWK